MLSGMDIVCTGSLLIGRGAAGRFAAIDSIGSSPTLRPLRLRPCHCHIGGLRELQCIVLGIAAREGAMTKQMQDKVCVVTGGAGSIGAASAKLLVEEGAK